MKLKRMNLLTLFDKNYNHIILPRLFIDYGNQVNKQINYL